MKTSKAVFIAPAIVLLLFKLAISLNTLVVSMKNFRPAMGVEGSPWVGFKNFTDFFGSPYFGRLLINTLILGGMPIILTCAVAAILVFCIANIPGRPAKYAALTVIAIPAFVPAAAFSGLMMEVLAPDKGIVAGLMAALSLDPINFFADAGSYPLVFAVMGVLRNAFIPVVIGLLAYNAQSNKVRSVGAALGVYACFRFAFVFSPDIETILLTYSPLTFASADVFETFIYRKGFLEASYSYASAVWVTKTVLQVIAAAGAAVGVLIFGESFKTTEKIENTSGEDSAAAVPAVVGFLVFAAPFVLVISTLFGFKTSTFPILFANPNIVKAISNSLLYTPVSSLLFVLVAVVLAYPLTFKTKWYPLIMFSILAINNNFIGEYLFANTLGMEGVSTALISTGFSAAGAFAIYFAVRNQFENTAPDISDYIRAVILPAAVLFCVAFIFNWGGYFYEMLYLRKRAAFSLSLVGREILLDADGVSIAKEIQAAVRFLMSVVPVGLGVVLIWFDAFLPVPILQLFTAKAKR